MVQLGIKGYLAQLAEGDIQVCQETEVTQVFKEMLEMMVFLDQRGIMVNLVNQEVAIGLPGPQGLPGSKAKRGNEKQVHLAHVVKLVLALAVLLQGLQSLQANKI